MLRQVPRQADQAFGERQPLTRAAVGGIKTGLGQRLEWDQVVVPAGQAGAHPVEGGGVDAQRSSDVAQSAATAVADHRSGQRGTITTILTVDVSDHFVAPLVFEVNVDIGRLVAFFRDKALEQ